MDSGRDSSALEYSADTLLQLTYRACVVPEEREIYDERTGKYKTKLTTLTPAAILEMEDEYERMRLKSDIILRVVKKRNGEPGRSMRFRFDGASSRFSSWADDRRNFQILPKTTYTPFDPPEAQAMAGV